MILSPDDFLAGRLTAGRHYALTPPAVVAKVSPDGKRALLLVADPSRMRVTPAMWTELLELDTGKRQRLPVESDWWVVTNWLPDGRVLLAGERVRRGSG